MSITARHAHVGNSAIRLKPECGNPREVAFAKKWQEDSDLGDTLEWLLSKTPNEKDGVVSDRDRMVAATVIQWLGSTCGMCFLRDVIKSSPEIGQWLKVI